MRILFIDQFTDLGGAQLCLLDLMPAVKRSGWEAHAAFPGEGPLAERLAAQGVAVHRIPLRNYTSGRKTLRDGVRFAADLPAVARTVRTLAERLDVALLYVNGPRLMPAVARARVARPVIFHAHSPLGGTSRAMVDAAIRKTGATVIAASRFLGWTSARVVYSGVEAPAVRRRPGSVPRIGLIGRMAPQKGQRQFVEAAARLPAHWEFYLCGDALFGDRQSHRYEESVLAVAPSSVRYLGWRDDVHEVLAELDLLVVPSAEEGGVPRVILEAFAARVPVLALESGATPEVVVDGENGFLLRSADPAEIAKRIGELMESREYLAVVSERAYALWRERFTVERYRSQICEIIAATIPKAAVTSKAGA